MSLLYSGTYYTMIRAILKVLAGILAIAAIAELLGLGYLYYGFKAAPSYWHGRANQQGQLLYVAIGDSAAQGVGASRPGRGYVGLIADRIPTIGNDISVRVVNLSKSGATLSDALREQIPLLDRYDATLVTIEIGANDMHNYNPEQFRRDYELLLQALPPGKSIVADIPYFGKRPQLNRNAQDANHTIRQLAQKYNIPTVGLYDTLATRQSPLIYAADFYHPNDRGYVIWYQAFWPHVQAIVSP